MCGEPTLADHLVVLEWSAEHRQRAEPALHLGEPFGLQASPVAEERLAERGVGRLIVTGAQTDACIRSTLHGAFTRGYDTLLVGDAHTTEDLSEYGAPPPDKVIAHTNLYWKYQTAPGRTAGVVDTADVSFKADEMASS